MTDTNSSSAGSSEEDSVQTSLGALAEDSDETNEIGATSADDVSLSDADVNANTSTVANEESSIGAGESPESTDGDLDDWDEQSPQDVDSDSESPETSTQQRVLNTVKTGLITIASVIGTGLFNILRRLYHLALGHTNRKEGLSGRFFPDEKISSDEEILFAATPSRWRAVGPYTLGGLFFLVAVLTPVAVYSGAYVSYFQPRSPAIISIHQPTYWWVFSLLCIFFGGLAVVGEMLHRGATWLVVTNHQIIKRWGVFTTHDEAFRIDDTQKLGSNQIFVEKVLGVGTIDASTPGDNGDEIKFHYINDPKRRHNIIREQRAARKGDTEDEVNPEPRPDNN